MKVLLIQNEQVVTTYNHSDTGNILPIVASLLMELILEETYVAGKNLFPALASINEQFKSVPGWKMRISDAKRRHPIPTLDGTVGYTGTFFVDYFCIDTKSGGKRLPRKRISVINLERFIRHPPRDPEQQLEMALALLDLAKSRGIKLRSSNGALGAGLLKTMSTWEKKRHAAPQFINRIGRKYLPGNYYSISSRVSGKVPFGYYLDQSGSHHSIAQSVSIPHPHYLRARGHFKGELQKVELWRNWTREGDTVFEDIMNGNHFGLVLARIYIGQTGRYDSHLYPPWAKKRGKKYVWLWTPELRFVQSDERMHLDSFMAGFTSTIRDPSIVQYATWALNYLRENNWTKPYTKPALLSAYGMLAFNSEDRPTIRRYWGGEVKGTKVYLPEAGIVSERSFTLNDKYQHAICNTIGRGIIEAETRTRSIEYAKELHSRGFHVAQIYSDGIFVETDQLPFIRAGWRIEGEHTNVSIPRSNAFISDQATKLPGIPRYEDDNRWLDIRNKSRQPLTATA